MTGKVREFCYRKPVGTLCGLWSMKFLGCWPISMEQSAIEAEGYIIEYWTAH